MADSLALRWRWLVAFVAIGLLASACGDGDAGDGTAVAGGTTTGRSSGQLAYTDDPEGENATSDRPATPSPGSTPAARPEPGTDPAVGPEPTASAGEQLGGEPLDSFVPTPRPDGIELVFADGALGPARLGSTIEEIGAALGPLYKITAEDSIRVDFPSGYSIAKAGEVLFWAIEEDGRITLFMSTNPKVGLDSGLRPKLPLDDAAAIHGEPTFTIGPEVREFVSFADGVGADGSLSVLVAIGEFGGPVGVYESGSAELGEETDAYRPDDANIKELWFWESTADGAEEAGDSGSAGEDDEAGQGDE